MDTSKLKPGEIIAAIGGLVLLIGILFLSWYATPAAKFLGSYGIDTSIGAWTGNNFLEVVANLIVLVAGVVGLGLAVVKVTSKSVSLPVAASALTAGTGIAAVLMVVLRILFKPASGLDLKYGIFVALIGAIVQSVGGWMSMKDEGTTFSEAKEQLSDRIGGDSGSEGGGPTGGAPPPPPPPGSGSEPPSGGGPDAA